MLAKCSGQRMNYEEGNNIHTEIEFFSLTILFLKTTIYIEIIKRIIKIGQKYLVLFTKPMVTL